MNVIDSAMYSMAMLMAAIRIIYTTPMLDDKDFFDLPATHKKGGPETALRVKSKQSRVESGFFSAHYS